MQILHHHLRNTMLPVSLSTVSTSHGPRGEVANPSVVSCCASALLNVIWHLAPDVPTVSHLLPFFLPWNILLPSDPQDLGYGVPAVWKALPSCSPTTVLVTPWQNHLLYLSYTLRCQASSSASTPSGRPCPSVPPKWFCISGALPAPSSCLGNPSFPGGVLSKVSTGTGPTGLGISHPSRRQPAPCRTLPLLPQVCAVAHKAVSHSGCRLTALTDALRVSSWNQVHSAIFSGLVCLSVHLCVWNEGIAEMAGRRLWSRSELLESFKQFPIPVAMVRWQCQVGRRWKLNQGKESVNCEARTMY